MPLHCYFSYRKMAKLWVRDLIKQLCRTHFDHRWNFPRSLRLPWFIIIACIFLPRFKLQRWRHSSCFAVHVKCVHNKCNDFTIKSVKERISVSSSFLTCRANQFWKAARFSARHKCRKRALPKTTDRFEQNDRRRGVPALRIHNFSSIRGWFRFSCCIGFSSAERKVCK